VSGGPATPPRLQAYDLPTGMNVNLERRPKCRWTRLLLGLSGCPKRSRVGSLVLERRRATSGRSSRVE
jgi:hypothetical protein